MKILMVCTGNICRSPMAEALLQHRLLERGCTDIDVVSAGTWALEGNPATDGAAAVLSGLGVDVSSHRARSLTPDLLREADLIVVMTSVHRGEVLEVDPSVEPKLVLMKELAEIERVEPTRACAVAALESLLQGRRPAWRRGLDLDDPYGMTNLAYERTLREIEGGVDLLAETLCPPDGSP